MMCSFLGDVCKPYDMVYVVGGFSLTNGLIFNSLMHVGVEGNEKFQIQSVGFPYQLNLKIFLRWFF